MLRRRLSVLLLVMVIELEIKIRSRRRSDSDVKVHAIGGYLPMRWVEYDHQEVSISMDKYSIHGRNTSP